METILKSQSFRRVTRTRKECPQNLSKAGKWAVEHEINEITPEIKKRGLVGAWKGKIKIIGDIDNVFNLAL